MKLKNWSLQKPETIFDPSKTEHRRAYFTFLQSSSWSASKFKFILEDDHLDLPSSINNKLLHYYIGKEFSAKKYQ